jgi:hypothetical protein
MKVAIQKYIKGNEGLLLKAGLIGAGYIFVVHPLLKNIGLFPSKEDKANAAADINNATGLKNAFNPNYYKGIVGAMLLSKADADAKAKVLYDAKDPFDDDEDDVYGVFRQLKAKTQVSWIADRFYALYQVDLYNYLRGFLSTSEMEVVNGIVNNLL